MISEYGASPSAGQHSRLCVDPDKVFSLVEEPAPPTDVIVDDQIHYHPSESPGARGADHRPERLPNIRETLCKKSAWELTEAASSPGVLSIGILLETDTVTNEGLHTRARFLNEYPHQG